MKGWETRESRAEQTELQVYRQEIGLAGIGKSELEKGRETQELQPGREDVADLRLYAKLRTVLAVHTDLAKM